MTKDNPNGASTGENADKNPVGPRKSRTIRFSDSEWSQVETAANEHSIPAAEFVRDAALSLAGGRSGEDSAIIPPGIIALIESTYRYTYVLATLKRDELIHEQRRDEVDSIVQAARDSQALLLKQASD